jgi:hypothetical protein
MSWRVIAYVAKNLEDSIQNQRVVGGLAYRHIEKDSVNLKGERCQFGKYGGTQEWLDRKLI